MPEFEKDETQQMQREHWQKEDFDEGSIDSLQKITNTIPQE